MGHANPILIITALVIIRQISIAIALGFGVGGGGLGGLLRMAPLDKSRPPRLLVGCLGLAAYGPGWAPEIVRTGVSLQDSHLQPRALKLDKLDSLKP